MITVECVTVTSTSHDPETAQAATDFAEPATADTPRIDRPVTLPLIPEKAGLWHNELRGRLGLLPSGARISQRVRKQGWAVTAVATFIAFVTRFWNLNHPHSIVFDETYYVKGAFSLLTQGFEGDWIGEDANTRFLTGDYSSLSTTTADYVVHPPLGKWLMTIGQALFGSDNGVGWRFTTAILGVAAVFLVARIAMRMFRSPWITAIAAGAMALDGMGIVMSRTGILDNIIAFFVLLAFYTMLLDREQFRARLAERVAHGELNPDGTPLNPWGPRIGVRPWLILTGLILGLACGIKWSGIYAIAVFGILVYVWSASARRAVGVKRWFAVGTLRDGISALFQLLPISIVAYLGAWTSWFLNPNSYNRGWAAGTLSSGGVVPLPWAPNIVNDFVQYHKSMWDFHHGLATPHDYQSEAWKWIFQLRPVSFFWNGTDAMASQCPSGSECVQAITSVGNPIVWWLAVIAVVVVLWAAFRDLDWRAWAILAGYAAMWLPWLTYTNRTIFQFYAVAFLPYVVLALAYGLAYFLGFLSPAHAKPRAFAHVVEAEEEEQHAAPQAEDAEDEEPAADEGAAADEDTAADETSTPTETAASMTLASFASSLTEPLDPEDPVAKWAASGANAPTIRAESPDWWQPTEPNKPGRIAVVAIMGLVVAAACFWMPIWWGTTVSYNFWHIHMWMQSWI